MPRNYDTTSHKPYPRITKIEIEYSEAGIPSIEYIEHNAVVDGNNEVQHIGVGATRHVFDLASISEPVQMIHPSTGLPIHGQTVTSQQLMLGLLVFLRSDQLRRDAQHDALDSAQYDASGAA